MKKLEKYLEGYIKWDGYCELNQGCPHWCGAHSFGNHILLLQHIHQKAAELISHSDFGDDWQLDIEVKDEYKEWYK